MPPVYCDRAFLHPTRVVETFFSDGLPFISRNDLIPMTVISQAVSDIVKPVAKSDT